MVTKNQIRNLIGKVEANVTEYSDSDSLYDGGILDSLKTIHLILLMEKEYGISIDQSSLQMEDLESVDRIHDFVNNLKEVKML